MVEEEHRNNAPIQNNAKGLRLGYNPYESGLLPRKPRRPRSATCASCRSGSR